MIEKWITWYNGVLSGTGLSDNLVIFIENATIAVITIGLAFLS